MTAQTASPRPGEDGEHVTYCRLCEAQCGMIVTVEDGAAVKIQPDRDHPVSEGHICVKGVAMGRLTSDPDRVTQPLKRVGAPGEFEPVSWDEALEDIAARLNAIVAEDPAGPLSMYLGNPVAFSTLHNVYGSLFSVYFGDSKLYTAAHTDIIGKYVAGELVYGFPSGFSFPDLPECDFLLMLGANPLVSHMSLISEPRAHRYLHDIADRDGVVVVDPRKTETARQFEHVPILPDTDIWFLTAMVKILIESGSVEVDLDRITGFDELRAAVMDVDLETAAERCRIPVDTMHTLAERLTKAKRAAVYGRVGTNRGTFSTLCNVLIEALNILSGNFGREGGMVLGVGTYSHLPPNPMLKFGARRSRIGDIPLVNNLSPSAELADDILTPGDRQTRALFVDSGNPVMSQPNGAKLEEALETLDLMVSLDLFVTETSKHAHYILPTTTFLERADVNDLWAGTAPRPWLQYSAAVLEPRGDVRREHQIYDEILQRAGKPASLAAFGQEPGVSPQIFDTVSVLLSGRPDGLTLDQVKAHPNGLRYVEKVDAARSWELVKHPDGKPSLWDEHIAKEFERFSKASTMANSAQMKLFGRRMLKSLNSWMHNDEKLTKSDRPTLQMNPADASRLGIEDGQMVEVRSKTGAIEVMAEITDDVIEGAVSYPHGWGHSGGWSVANALGGANVNALASSDPEDWPDISGATFLDGIPVDVRPLAQA